MLVAVADVLVFLGLEECLHGLVALDEGLFLLDDDLLLLLGIDVDVDKRLPQLVVSLEVRVAILLNNNNFASKTRFR